jgi:acyl-CoA thioester hydrolase
MEHLLKAYPVIVEIPLAWGEMDALRHINNVVYFRYFENARIAYFEKIKFWEFMKNTGIGPILASTKCKYIAPLTFPDTVLVGTRTTEIKEDRFVMKYGLASKRLQRIAAKGEALLVTYNYNEKRKAPFPESLRRIIVELESSVKASN